MNVDKIFSQLSAIELSGDFISILAIRP